jgi:subtilisin family serine protease
MSNPVCSKLSILAAAISLALLCAPSAQAVGIVAAPQLTQGADDARPSVDGRVAVFVELVGSPATEVFNLERRRFLESRSQSGLSAEELTAEAERVAARFAFTAASALLPAQLAMIDKLSAQFSGRILFNSRFANNGIAVLLAPSQLDAVRGLPGVRRVSLMVAQTPDAVSSIDFTGTRSFWGTAAPDNNRRGAGIGVGVIDTGIDHMHTALGGPGGTAYAANVTTATAFPAPPAVPVSANFPTPKVVWGFDFAGDAYNANGTTDAVLLPLPDPNPMDTNSHGTAVSSLMAGFGSNNDGTTYAGPFNRTQPNIAADLRVTPGYAPESALYAFRVFGTTGSTQLTAGALDAAAAVYLWQADTSIPWDGTVSATVFNALGAPVLTTFTLPQPPATPRLRVINLSLGSNAGDIEEISALAAQRAADAGLIVVMSAGNAYDSYYITGSPGVATGGISVAASLNDQFPGGVANAPANAAATPVQPAISGLSILQVGAASFSSASLAVPLTDAVYARPPYGNVLAALPAGCTAPVDPGFLVTLQDPAGVAINSFTCNAGVIEVSLNPAANNIYAGKIVLIDRGGAVGFHQKGLAVQRAGGVATVVVNNAAGAIPMAVNANLPLTTIPGAMIDQALGATFTLDGSQNLSTLPVPGRVNLQTRPNLQLSFQALGNLTSSDTMAIYSSRGPRRGDDAIKPDISAPAENVAVASATTGNQARSFNGTSSAAPHTAGAITLLRAINPTWSNYELKAQLINNSGNDIFTAPGSILTQPPTGQTWNIGRQGVGRWDLSRYSAGGSKVILFGQDPATTGGGAPRTGAITVSYGVVDVENTIAQDRNVTVRNKGITAQSFNIGWRSTSDTPGVNYSFPDGNTITVPALSERIFRIRLNATAADMRLARDGSTRPFQFIGAAPGTRSARQIMNEEGGYITLTPSTGGSATHRLTVQAFPRRASAVSAPTAPVTAGQPANVTFTGTGFNTGTALAFTNPPTFDVNPAVNDIAAFAKPFELAFVSTTPAVGITPSQSAADISHVGIVSDALSRATPFDTTPAPAVNQSAVVTFGISTRGEWDTVQSGFGAEFRIEIDTNNDTATVERAVRQFAFVNTESGAANSASNVSLPVVSTAPPAFGTATSTGWNLNVFNNIWTNLYGGSVLFVPVSVTNGAALGAGSLGLTAATSRFNYRVIGLHRGVQISQTAWLTYDVLNPGVSFANGAAAIAEPSVLTPFTTAGTASAFSINSDAGDFAANNSQGVLMLYPMNTLGNRAQVIPVQLPDAVFANGFESP